LDGKEQLAEIANLGLPTVRDFERGRRKISDKALMAVRRALEEAGARFQPAGKSGGVGVRLVKN
jgi:hypothetical protein